MAEVKIIPKISCDNCGRVEDKELHTFNGPSYEKPKLWGSLQISGGRTDSYGIKGQMAFTDLCQECALAAIDAAADALKARRGEIKA